MRQLNLFKRGKGDRIPPPKERALHIAFADAVRVGISPGWCWTHIPLGEYRTPATAALLKRMGVKAGAPDFIFVGPRGVAFIELKREGSGRLSDEQLEWQRAIFTAGCCYHCTTSVEDALGTLADLGIVRVRVSA